MFSQVGKLFRLVKETRPQSLAWSLASAVARMLEYLLDLFLVKTLIDGVSGAYAGSWQLHILYLLAARFILYAGNKFAERKVSDEQANLQDAIEKRFSEKTLSMKYEYLEDPEILQLRTNANAPIEYGVLFTVLEAGQSALSSALIIISTAVILLRFNWILF